MQGTKYTQKIHRNDHKRERHRFSKEDRPRFQARREKPIPEGFRLGIDETGRSYFLYCLLGQQRVRDTLVCTQPDIGICLGEACEYSYKDYIPEARPLHI